MAEHKLTARQLFDFLKSLPDLDIPVVVPAMIKGEYRDAHSIRSDYVNVVKKGREKKAVSVVVIEI